jgi:eukaryotic-like serine/threonine-protein kinase
MAQPFQSHAVTAEAPGAYQPLFELGRGGMGTVFIARALGAGGFERLVVIKRLHAHLTEQSDAVRRFLDEARIAASVRHANVVGTLQVGSDDEGYFLVLDYVEGASLENLLDYSALRQVPIDPPVVLRIALDACAGLQAVHDAEDSTGRPLQILHRDVSLQNVLVGRDGVARIADFGVAKSAFASVSTDKSYVVGKLLYLPAEYLLRDPTGPSLDVYSLGMTVWLTLSGKEPWPGASEAQLVRHIVESEAPLLSTVMDVAPQIERLVAKACRRKCEERYQSAREMAADIEAIARETGWVATHAEVAAFVQKLAGPDLRRRRELVAEALARADQAPQRRRIMHSSAPPPVRKPELADTGPKAPRTDDAPEASAMVVAAPASRPATLPIALAIGGLAIAAGLGGWFWQRSTVAPAVDHESASATAPAAERIAAPATPAPTAPANTAPTTAPLPPPPPAPEVKPATSVAAPAPAPRPHAPRAKSASAAAAAPAPAAPAAASPPVTAAPAAPSPAPEPIQGPRAPDGISRKNPYRNE